MLKFKRFLEESAKARVGLPHITTMKPDQFHDLVKHGKVHMTNATEKTDGMTHVMGHDEHGFYTQSSSSGSDKMRHPNDYYERALKRSQTTGKPFDPTSSHAFGEIHHTLANNKKLQDHLKDAFHKKGEDVKVRGEMFYKKFGTPSDVKGEIKFVGTSYDPSHMGRVGKYVIHSKLPDNQDHDISHFKKKLSDHNINFDDDITHHKMSHVDVSDIHSQFKKLNHEVLSARTTNKNRSEKEAEISKFDNLKKIVAKRVDNHVNNSGTKPKWGSGTEGLVIHPSEHNSDAPRFKVTSDAFRKFKADTKGKDIFKRK